MGIDILSMAVSKGYTKKTIEGSGALKGEKGEPGADGKSAYEVAVKNGFIGTITEWLESLKGETILTPEQFGAVGDGVTYDDAAFDNFDLSKTYYLADDKIYRVKSTTMKKIWNASICGNGKIRVGVEGVTDYDAWKELSVLTRNVRNEIEADFHRICTANAFNVTDMYRWTQLPGVKRQDDVGGAYQNIGAIYLNRDIPLEDAPKTFTFCIGRSAVFQRRMDTQEWVKTIDCKNFKYDVINYKLPWTGGTRTFNHKNEAKLVDGHYEIQIDTEELATWLGTPDENAQGSCAHFWSSRHSYMVNEYDHLASSWVVWVKEKEAENLVVFAGGIDAYQGEEGAIAQAYYGCPTSLTSNPRTVWGHTMTFNDMREFGDTDGLLTMYYNNLDYNKMNGIPTKEVSEGGYNPNLIGFEDFEVTNKNSDDTTATLRCKDGLFTIDGNVPGWWQPDLSKYLKTNVKSGTYLACFQYEEDSASFGDWIGVYFNKKSVSLLSNTTTASKPYNSVSIVLDADLTNFSIAFSNVKSDGKKFRIWLIADEEFYQYTPYGESVSGIQLNRDIVIDKQLESYAKKEYVDAQIEYKINYITPEQYGAIGDGVTDDTRALQDMFYYAREKNLPIKLGYKKTYICRGGSSIGLNSVLDGNYSKILVDQIDFTKTPHSENFTNNFYLDGSYNSRIDLFDWKNIEIEMTVPQMSETSAKCMNLFHFYDVGTFKMDNCKIVYNGSEKNGINLFKFSGRANAIINNCYFENHNAIVTGGSIIWWQSNGFNNEGHVARVTNTTMISDCWDEILSHYLGGTHDIIYDNCTINKTVREKYYSISTLAETAYNGFLFTFIYKDTLTDTNGIYHKVFYNKCDISLSAYDGFNAKNYPYGIANAYNTPTNVKFIDCNLDYSNINQLSQMVKIAGKTYDSVLDYQRRNLIEHLNCKINVQSITGKYGLFPSDSCSSSFKGCEIKCPEYITNDLWVNNGYCSDFRLELVDNLITVNNCGNFVFKVNPLNKEMYIIANNEFITDNADTSLWVENSSATGQGTAYFECTDSIYSKFIDNNRLNSVDFVVIEDIDFSTWEV